MALNVSPFWTLQVGPAATFFSDFSGAAARSVLAFGVVAIGFGAGAAAASAFASVGMASLAPTLRLLGVRPGLSAAISVQRLSLPSVRRAISASESPFCTTYSPLPAAG